MTVKPGGGGGLDILHDSIGMHPGQDMTAPLMQSVGMKGHYAVGSDTIVGKLRREKTL